TPRRAEDSSRLTVLLSTEEGIVECQSAGTCQQIAVGLNVETRLASESSNPFASVEDVSVCYCLARGLRRSSNVRSPLEVEQPASFVSELRADVKSIH